MSRTQESKPMQTAKLCTVGDLINNAYARARKAFLERDVKGYQNLARIQTDLGVDYLDVNLDATKQIQVKPKDMLDFLPEVIPALQEASPLPLCFDSPSREYHQVALRHYDHARGGRPILDSIAASRGHLDEMIGLVAEYDTMVIIMASERVVDGGVAQCFNPREVHEAAKHFVELLATKASRTNDQIIIDPGLAPVGADTYGIVNTGLDAMRLIRKDPDLRGVHITVGLSNFAWGTPKHVRHELEKAYLTSAAEAGLDFPIVNPESALEPLPGDHRVVGLLREALNQGRAAEGESRETAGFRQAEAVMNIWKDAESEDT
jgi:5-methyltetrahydrofolate corrinoid/iron sulfur protein methyltransferase